MSRKQTNLENKYLLLEIRKVIEAHMEIFKTFLVIIIYNYALKMKIWVNDYFLGKEITRFDSKSS